MKKNIVYWGICIAFFGLYFKILGFVWGKFVPFDTVNAVTNIIQIFIVVVVNIPLSVICTEKVFEIIKKNNH